MTTQRDQDQLKNMLSSEFVRRNDLTFSWAQTIGYVKALPGFKAAWFASDYDTAGDMRNQNGDDAPIAAQGTPTFGMGAYCPHAQLSGSDYFQDTVGYVITGTESHIDSADRGVTIAGVINPKALTGSQFVASQWGAVNADQNYQVRFPSAAGLYFYVRDTIVGNTGFLIGTATVDTWLYFMASWNQAADTVETWFNDSYTLHSPAGLTSLVGTSTTGFAIGARSDASNYLTGNIGWIALYDQSCAIHRSLREISLGGWPFA